MAATPDHISRAFSEARQRAGLSMAEVSRRLRPYGMDVSASTVTKWESGERGISMEAAMRLCDVLGVRWDDLYSAATDSQDDPVTLEVLTLANQMEIITGQAGLSSQMMRDWPDRLDEITEDHSNGLPSDIRTDLGGLSARIADLRENLDEVDAEAVAMHGILTRLVKRLDVSR